MVIKPRPPICINIIITVFPKVDQWVAVSTMVNPVTQTADVAVNKALIIPILCLLLLAIGRFKSVVPITIIIKNPITNICGGLNCFFKENF